MKNGQEQQGTLNLRAGEMVQVRDVDEILATLDERARLEALPFMPEMLKFAGQRFRVSARADRTCDRVERKGIRNMLGAVHLEGVRCDGGFHDGCDAACLIYWKEAWLKRVDDRTGGPSGAPGKQSVSRDTLPQAERIFAATTKGRSADGNDTIYSCQATESLEYTSAPSVGQTHSYFEDVRCGNVRWYEAARAYLVERFNAFQQTRGGTNYPPLEGALAKTPVQTLDLKPGELVQVRTRKEIVDTLDIEGKNRGLTFDREMLIYCGGSYRVLKRVEKIIDEPSGKMMPMKRDCVILEGAVCTSRYHGLCQRRIYAFWREIWLRRTNEERRAPRGGGEGSFATFVAMSAMKMIGRRLFRRKIEAEG